MKRILSLAVLFSFCFSTYSFAKENDIDQLLSLDLEELLVSVASKRDEKISDAPGIVNVLSSEDIKNSGARTLFEALERLPDVFNVITSTSPERALSIRGNISAIGDTHVLILINGRPIREGYSGAFNGQVWRNFPLNSVERVEVIRGPGSVLYGSNAFAGVVNVVTKKARKALQGEASVLYGTHNTRQVEGNFGREGENGQFLFAVKADDTDGRSSNGNNILGNPIDDRFSQDNVGVTLQADYKNFTLNILQTHSGENINNLPATLTSFNEISSSSFFIDLGYEHDFSDRWIANINTSFSRNAFDLTPLTDFATKDWYLETTVNGQLNDHTNLLFGGSYNILEGEENLSALDYSTSRVSLYSQLDYQLTDWFKAIGGVQFNYAEDVDSDISPRLGGIFSFDKNWGAKVLYGEAFRAPYPGELFINRPPLIVGNPDLEPETIKTYDAQVFYKNFDFEASLTGFFSKQENTIVTQANTFSNGEDVSSYGGTVEGKYNITPSWSANGSITYQQNKTDSEDNFYQTPNTLVKTGVTYKNSRGITFDLFNQYVNVSAAAGTSAIVNPSPDDFNLVNANLIIDVPTFFKRPELLDAEFAISGTNLLGVDTFGPDTSFTNTFEQRDDQAVFAKATLRF